MSTTEFSAKSDAIDKLNALADECSSDGWDGEDAEAISRAVTARTIAFIRALPSDLPLPDFAPEPDGSISLDWILSRSRLLSLSVGAGTRLAYAWLDDEDRGHAVAHFDGAGIPWRVLEEIRGLTGCANPPVRAD